MNATFAFYLAGDHQHVGQEEEEAEEGERKGGPEEGEQTDSKQREVCFPFVVLWFEPVHGGVWRVSRA